MEPIDRREIARWADYGGKFLRTLSTRREIMLLMTALGYSQKEHDHGISLYMDMMGFKRTDSARPVTEPIPHEQREGLLKIDAFDERAFRRADAALTRLHPEHQKAMFGTGLKPAKGFESISTVTQFLDTYAAWRTSRNAADKAAARTLEDRGIINPEKEKELRALIQTVGTLADVPQGTVEPPSDEELQIAARKFIDWLRDWRTTASAGISRRDFRLALGIGSRKSPKSGDSDADGPPNDDNE